MRRCQGKTKTNHRCSRKATNGLRCFQHQSNSQRKQDTIIVYNPKNKVCEEGDGIDAGYDEVPKDVWERLKKGIRQHTPHFDRNIEHDYSNGGHGCVMEFNLYKLYQGLIIVKKIPEEAKNVSVTNLIDELIEHLEEVSPSPKKPDRRIIKIGKIIKVAEDDDEGEDAEEIEKVEVFIPSEIRDLFPDDLLDDCYCCSDVDLGKNIDEFHIFPAKIKDIRKFCKENKIDVMG